MHVNQNQASALCAILFKKKMPKKYTPEEKAHVIARAAEIGAAGQQGKPESIITVF